MKILIVDTYYPDFLKFFYEKEKGLECKNYNVRRKILLDEAFGTADFYSSNLKKLGCDSQDIIANDEILQKRWAEEHGIKFSSGSSVELVRKFSGAYGFLRKNKVFFQKLKDFFNSNNWTFQILNAQIKEYKPDILYVLDINLLSPFFLKKIKNDTSSAPKLIAGQIASPLPPDSVIKEYGLMVSSFPHFVEKFKKMGINSEFVKHAFEPRILEAVGSQEKKYKCSFVGGISSSHGKSVSLLEKAAKETNIDFFGYGKETLDKSSPIFLKHHGPVWGREMYKTLSESQITINRHIDVAENYANNLRLYEATGMGTMLITDKKENLNELFEIGKEVETYSSSEELIEKIKYFSEHTNEREKIAKAGQQRTLKEHTYTQRMQQLLNIFKKYL